MLPSAQICREQQAIQRLRAANAPLANVRLVAERAVTAWSHELIAAEKRDARQERMAAIRAAEEIRKQAPERHECCFSENPDLGNVSPSVAKS